jgi:hypothetical protein
MAIAEEMMRQEATRLATQDGDRCEQWAEPYSRAKAERLAATIRAFADLFREALAEPVAEIVGDLDAGEEGGEHTS